MLAPDQTGDKSQLVKEACDIVSAASSVETFFESSHHVRVLAQLANELCDMVSIESSSVDTLLEGSHVRVLLEMLLHEMLLQERSPSLQHLLRVLFSSWSSK